MNQNNARGPLQAAHEGIAAGAAANLLHGARCAAPVWMTCAETSARLAACCTIHGPEQTA
jgi:hypothetical protein